MKQKIIAVLLVAAMLLLPCGNFAPVCAAAQTDYPACSCRNEHLEELSAHADGCDRKAYCRELSKLSADELYATWGKLPVDIRVFVLTYLSWTNWNKYQTLNALLENFVEPPVEDDDDDLVVEPEEGKCICDPEQPYGSLDHKIACLYHFMHLPVEEEYIVYVTMTREQQSAALGCLAAQKKSELEAYIAAHPFASTVSADGVSVTTIDVPKGATVTAEVVDKEFTESLLPSITIANQAEFVLDIKVYDANGNAYQPSADEPVMVKVSMQETEAGDKTDFVHILDTVSAIEAGLADGSVKLLDLSDLFVEEKENGEIVEISPNLSDAYLTAFSATEQLGYNNQLAYEIVTGVCVDDGYSIFYLDSFSMTLPTSLSGGTYYIGWDLRDEDGNGGWNKFKGYWTVKNMDDQQHDYYYTSISSISVPSGSDVTLIFVRGNVPLSGSITVNGKLTAKIYDGASQIKFYGRRFSSWHENDDKTLEPQNRYDGSNASVNPNTIHRASGNTGALFNVKAGGELTLWGENATHSFLIDGKSISASGSAIISEGKVTLTNVTIRNNYHTSGYGAGINSSSAYASSMSNIIISGCKAKYGGGIHLGGTGSNTLNTINISSCEAGETGGGINTGNSSTNTITGLRITSCTAYKGAGVCTAGSGNNTFTGVANDYDDISGCVASYRGGGFTIAGTSKNTIKNMYIDNCQAASDGGGINVEGSAVNQLTSVSITNCKAVEGSAMYIDSRGGTLNANSCTIKNNSTTNPDAWGGTIRTNGMTVSSATFTGCDVSNNYSGRHGGGFYWNAGTTSKLTIDSCNIHDNRVEWSGGGIFCESYIEIKGSTNIYNNVAVGTWITDGEPGGGGGICVNAYHSTGTTGMTGSQLVLANTIKIYGNSTSSKGGGIFMHVYPTDSLTPDATFSVQLNGASVYSNNAATGGGIYVYRQFDASTYNCFIDLNYGEFKDNTAASGNGGGVYGENIDIDIGNASGTAMTISGNKAANGYGGAVYSTGTMGAVTITNGTLISNSAYSGGAIAISDGVVSISGGTLSSNSATEYGGAVYTTGTNASCTISNGTLQSNSAKHGGAIGVINGWANIKGGTISGNTATEYGGGIGVANGTVSIEGGAVNSNTSGLYGGGIFAAGTVASISVSGQGSISSNTADNGGGIYATLGASVNVTGGIISNNSAKGTPSVKTAYSDAASTGVGGGIYVGNGTSEKSSSISISGTAVGLYGNTADFAAADAFASGTYTQITLPEVTNMNLTGFSGSATGWFEDYVTNDTGYANGFQGGDVGERYANARNTREITSASGVTKYAAITLGTTKTGYGNLTIHTAGSNIDPDQVFIYTVSGNGITLQVSLEGVDSITIYELLDGTYTVTEDTDWSWRYTPSAASVTTTISGSNVNPTLTFDHSRTNNNWLSAFHDIINVKG